MKCTPRTAVVIDVVRSFSRGKGETQAEGGENADLIADDEEGKQENLSMYDD
jgi:hypothetical protein